MGESTLFSGNALIAELTSITSPTHVLEDMESTAQIALWLSIEDMAPLNPLSN